VLHRPAGRIAPETLGIRNILQARVVRVTPDRVTLDWEGLRLHAPAQKAARGEMVPVYVAPEEVKVLYPDRPALGGLAVNQLDATVVSLDDRPELRVVQVRVSNGQELEVRGGAHFYRELDLRPGARIQVSLRLEGVRILHESPETPARP
jgi:molybdate transport system ATP-binding protein